MKSHLSRIAAAAAVVVAVLGAAPPAAVAAVNNGSFTAGLAGWSVTGNAGADAVSQFGPPVAPAAAQGVVGTAGTSAFLFGGAAIGAAALEAALGVAAGTLTGIGAIDGSALMQSFNAKAGDVLRFDWKLMTNEPQGSPANDTAFGVLDGAMFKLTDVQTAALLGASLSPMIDETAYKSFTSGALAAGVHTIAFGIVDVPDALGASALAVTNIAAVPEPPVGVLLAAGLLAMPWFARRRGRPQE